jgi:Fic-DOC domain mobile mystery protein B
MGLSLKYEKGQTPLSEEEMEQLLIHTITTQGELNEMEQLNIEEAVEWTMRRTFKAADIFSEEFVRDLHKRMYRQVWRWAGQFRTSDKNIGIAWYQIPASLKNLVDDADYWVKHSVYSSDELAIKFKHVIVSIHCFPNGNGRHSRLMADIIVNHIFKQPTFSWNRRNLVETGEARKIYLASLAEADQGNLTPLMTFARS